MVDKFRQRRHRARKATERGNFSKGPDCHASVTPRTDTDLDPDEDKEKIETGTLSSGPKCPHSKIVKLWNDICAYRPNVGTSLSGARKRKIKECWDKFGRDIGNFKQVFETVHESNFLCTGEGGNWNGANFDWVMKPDNFQKILEGVYDEDPFSNTRPTGGNNRQRKAPTEADYAKGF